MTFEALSQLSAVQLLAHPTLAWGSLQSMLWVRSVTSHRLLHGSLIEGSGCPLRPI